MPFSVLPSSPGFVPPAAPRWEPFALESIRELENRPYLHTADLVQQAVSQINNILQLQSPVAKAQRQLQLLQLQTMQDVYNDYRQHPENYQMTANGPVMIKPLDRYLKLSQINKNLASTAWLQHKSQPGNVPQTVAEYNKRLSELHKGNASVSQVGAPTEGTPVSGTDTTATDQEQQDDNTGASIAGDDSSGVTEGP